MTSRTSVLRSVIVRLLTNTTVRRAVYMLGAALLAYIGALLEDYGNIPTG